MIAGALELIMSANLARLASEMQQAKQIVGSATASMEANVASLKSALGALGVGLSIGYFTHLIAGSIEAMDHLDNLKKSTSLTVEELAGLSVLAKQTGTDVDGLAKGVDRMSVAMGKSPEKFAALGVSAKDPLEALKQFADIFNLLPDIQQRNALAQAVFNKSWAEMAPLLSMGGQRIGEAIEKGSQLAGVTEEMAKQANELTAKWVELVGTGGLLTSMVGPMLPLLNQLAGDMLKARDNAHGLNSEFSPMLETLKVLIILASDVSFVFTTMGKDMARAAENVKLIATGQWERSRELGKQFAEDAKKAREELDAWQQRIMGLGKPTTPVAPGGAMDMGGSGTIFTAADAAAAAARAKAFLRDDYAARIAVIKIGGEAFAAEIRTANTLAELAMKEGGVSNQRTAEELLRAQAAKTLEQLNDARNRQAEIMGLSSTGEQTPEKVKAAASAAAEIQKINAAIVASETITQAQIRAERTVTAQQQVDQYNAWADGQAKVGETIAMSFRTQAEIENKSYEDRKAALEVFIAAQGDEYMRGAQDRIDFENQHQAALGDVMARGAVERQKFAAMTAIDQTNFALGEMVQMTAGAAAHNKTMFEINKVAAIANAAMKGQQAIINSYEWGTEWGGPYAGAAMAAIAAAATAINIKAIGSASFGGGVGASVSGAAGGAVPTFQTNPQAAAAAAPAAASPTVVYVTVTGVVTHDVIDQMIEQLSDAIDHHDFTIIGPNSRQAAIINDAA